MSLTHRDLRKKFKAFWEKRGHREVPPTQLVPPQGDSTTLFTGSGMQQFVPNLLGEPHPQGTKLFNIQPCFRAQDIDEVGDNRHTTFFEMMGNWSLGDYFKEKQLGYFFTFLTDKEEGLGIDPNKLYVTAFEGYKEIPKDNVSVETWKKLFAKVGIKAEVGERIFLYGPEKNWWSRAGVPENMPAGEPGGPDSEVFFQFDLDHDPKFGEKCHPNCDCGRFLEIGNSVFMEYKKLSDGSFEELPKKNVDFGGGLERILMAIKHNNDVFHTDIFYDLYQYLIDKINFLNDVRLKRVRIFLDHSRASMFLIHDGVMPGKNDKESVLRVLIRKADDQLNILFQGDREKVESIWDYSFEHFRKIYSNNFVFSLDILKVIKDELIEYQKTYKYRKEENDIFKVKFDPSNISASSISLGSIAATYRTTYGVPFDTSLVFANELGADSTLFEKGFKEKMGVHQEISGKGATKKFKGGLADHSDQVIKYHTATHLIHQALFDVLGDKVRQEGSNITGERLRFDFFATNKPTDDEIKKVEEIVNKKIKDELPVNFKIMPKSEADKVGARSFFKEKYGDQVKVYFIGNNIESAYSKEFCGGPHVKNTKEIGKLKIDKFKKIGSNLYRIYAV